VRPGWDSAHCTSAEPARRIACRVDAEEPEAAHRRRGEDPERHGRAELQERAEAHGVRVRLEVRDRERDRLKRRGEVLSACDDGARDEAREEEQDEHEPHGEQRGATVRRGGDLDLRAGHRILRGSGAEPWIGEVDHPWMG
jgi:hypothetical protein